MKMRNRRRFWLRWSMRLAILLLLTLAGVSGWLWLQLHRSLPQLEGDRALAALAAPVRIERDAEGVPLVDAGRRRDAAVALGFLHAQERFFQMDLLRRLAAGELAELVGAGALPLDRRHRLQRFRARAEHTLTSLPAADRELLAAYVDGVNAGLQALDAVPFEYLLLGGEPRPWRPADSLLVVYSMYLRLQAAAIRQEWLHDRMRHALPALADFLLPSGTRLDAPLDASAPVLAPLPGPAAIDFRALPSLRGPAGGTGDAAASTDTGTGTDADAIADGSNAWALAGARSAGGGALLANDMHLNLELPNAWYRAALRFDDGGAPRQVTGVTLPGLPAIVAGSNGDIAWGFTNSYGDWADLVVVERSGDGYRTPDGVRPFERHPETIRVRGAEPETLTVTETRWGPLIGRDGAGRPLALRWVAHDPRGVDLGLLRMETAASLETALTLANRAGTPAQNVLIVHRDGAIGWTLTGPVPRRIGELDGRRPSSWSDGTRGWDGWHAPEATPRRLTPPDGQLWSANARAVGGAALALVGDGGYALGARAGQIRDALRTLSRPADEAALLALQLDDRALWLEPWRALLLRVLDAAQAGAGGRERELRELLSAWNGRAGVDAAGYRLLREYRALVARAVFEPVNRLLRGAEDALAAPSGTAAPDERATLSLAADDWLDYTRFRQLEGPLRRLLEARPLHLLNPRYQSWDMLLQAALRQLLARYPAGELSAQTWGERNRLSMRHPLSRFVPLVGLWLDMPAAALPGGVHLPRVQGPDKGASQRMVVSPGRERDGIFHMPGGQSGHPLSPYYGAGHDAWEQGRARPFLPGAARWRLRLRP